MTSTIYQIPNIVSTLGAQDEFEMQVAGGGVSGKIRAENMGMHGTGRYFVYFDSSIYKVKNRQTGAVEASNADADQAIQYAIDTCAITKGMVSLAGGTLFSIKNAINLKTGVDLVGDGPGALIRMVVDTPQDLLRGIDISDVTLRGIEVDGNRAIQSRFVNDSNHNNIHFVGSSNIAIYRCNSYNGVYHGIFVTTATGAGQISENIHISGNHLHANGFRGCHVHGTEVNLVSQVVVTENFCEANGQDLSAGLDTGMFIAFDNQYNTVCSNNVIRREPGYGLHIEGFTIGSTIPGQYATLSNNTVSECSTGVNVTGSFERAAIQGNIISTSVNHGLQLSGYARGIAIQGNIITHNGAYGIICQISSPAPYEDIAIIGNSILDNGNRGIQLRDVVTGSITGNILDDNGADPAGSDGILIRGSSTRNILVASNVITSTKKTNTGAPSLRVIEATGTVFANNICLSRDSGTQILVEGSAIDTYLNANVGTVSDSGTNTRRIDYP